MLPPTHILQNRARNNGTKGPFFRALRQGSMTVEAALAAPLFLICMVALICMTDMYGMYVRQLVRLQEQAEINGAAAAAGQDIVDLPGSFIWDVPGFGLFGGHARIACRARVRTWTGRDPARNEGCEEEGGRLVYVTEHGRVYHTDPACSHIDLSLHPADSGELEHLRNAGGSRYHACDKCVGHGTVNATVFITDDGDCFHNSAACSGLRRTVRLVTLEEAGSLPHCSRCAAEGK